MDRVSRRIAHLIRRIGPFTDWGTTDCPAVAAALARVLTRVLAWSISIVRAMARSARCAEVGTARTSVIMTWGNSWNTATSDQAGASPAAGKVSDPRSRDVVV